MFWRFIAIITAIFRHFPTQYQGFPILSISVKPVNLPVLSFQVVTQHFRRFFYTDLIAVINDINNGFFDIKDLEGVAAFSDVWAVDDGTLSSGSCSVKGCCATTMSDCRLKLFQTAERFTCIPQLLCVFRIVGKL